LLTVQAPPGRAAAQRFYRQLELVAGFSRQITLENTYRSALVANDAAKTGIVRGAPVSIATGRGKLRNAPKATAGRQNVARRDVPGSDICTAAKQRRHSIKSSTQTSTSH
jgi:hypothetical protein